MKTNEWYENNKDEILNLYYSGERIPDICSKLECNKSMIYRKFNEWNINRRERVKGLERYNAIYKINQHYFDDIDCEHKAYWLGIITSDGFVNDKEISLCLKNDDVGLIKQFKEDLQAEHPIKINKDGNPFITICCKPLCNVLQSYGLHNRKSWNLDIDKIINSIPDEYIHHFIRGLFDGDGSIRYYQYDYLKKLQFHFGYTGLQNVCGYIKNKLDIQRNLVHEGNVTYTLVTRDPLKITEIFNYLYKDATIYLSRKYKTFNEIQMMTFNDYNKAISNEIKV